MFTMIKRLFLLSMLGGTFLGGYYLGHQPDSPDIFAMAQKGYEKVAGAGDMLSDMADTAKSLQSANGAEPGAQGADADNGGLFSSLGGKQDEGEKRSNLPPNYELTIDGKTRYRQGD